jgi:signal transduction histidine kinase/CHASE1-domain containing sensor protein
MSLRRHVSPAVVLATGIAASIGGGLYLGHVVELQQDERIREQVRDGDEALHRRLDAYTAILRATRGLFDGLARDPTQDEFRQFVASLDLARKYPGIQGIGWTKLLSPGEVAPHEAAMRAKRHPSYRVWPEGERAVYTSIVDLEPLSWRNRRAIGFDMFTEPVRRSAMERARDTGDVAASGKVELVQEIAHGRQAGFLVYVPVYQRPPRDLGERRELIRGWVYAPFRAADLLRGTLGPEGTRTTAVTVYDGPEQRADAVLHQGAAERPVVHTSVERMEVAGRTWTVRFGVTAAFASPTERLLPIAVIAVGLAATLFLFWMTRADARGRERAEQAAVRASFLAEAGKVLSSSLECERSLQQVADLASERIADGCVVYLLEHSCARWMVGHRDAALAHRAATVLDALGVLESGTPGPAEALAAREPRVRNDVHPERLPFAAAAPGLVAVMREAGVRALLSVPMFARGQEIGAIVLLSSGRRFGQEDVRVGEDLARLVAAAVDSSRMFRRAQEAVAARDEFLSIASHELKTPLTSLVLQADSVRMAARRGQIEQAQRMAERIRRSADRLASLIASLLDISRISSGRLDLELEPVDLAEIARDVTARFEEEARRRGSAIRLVTAGTIVGSWDRMRLDQVVTNLLSNALKYGSGRPVEVRVGSDGDRAFLTVTDEGIGIPEPDQRRIFERFERAVSRRNYGGFGLGLWIVRQIVEALGGSVRVDSSPDRGSTFTVVLAREARAAVPPASPEMPAPPSDGRGSPVGVLPSPQHRGEEGEREGGDRPVSPFELGSAPNGGGASAT